MGKYAFSLAALLLAVTVGCKNTPQEAQKKFHVEVMNGYTPVKNQGRSETCWIFAMLAAIETEHIGRGDSVNLSPYYVERKVLERNAQRCYFASGRSRLSMRGTGMMLINAIEEYGVVPYDAYHKGQDVNTTVLANKLKRVVAGAAGSATGLEECGRRTAAVLDGALGPMIRRVYMFSAEYTSQEFAHSVCAPDEYEALTSFTHHPFNSRFALEIPDNRDRDQFFNVPIDTLTQIVEQAVRAKHGVCWEGDISNDGFSFAKGIADMPGGIAVTQESRQRAFERFQTTDDHCMSIVGIANLGDDAKYFIMKNSWGTGNPYGGLMFMSFDYFRQNTVAIFMPKSAMHKD